MTSDWAMVIITAVYVVATIFICCANIKSAKASQAQVTEMQRQFAESNRPEIEVEFHYLRRAWYVIRFVNRGEKTAQHVKINIAQSFIDSLTEEAFKKECIRIKGRECIIGVGQHYDLFIGSNKFRGNPNMEPFTGTVEYESQGKAYQSDLFVDCEHYMTFFSSTTDEEDLLKSMKKMTDELKGIKQALHVQTAIEDNNDQDETSL